MASAIEMVIQLVENIPYKPGNRDQQKLPTILAILLSDAVNNKNRYILSAAQVKSYEWILEAISPFAFAPTVTFRAQIGVYKSTSGSEKHKINPTIKSEMQTPATSLSGREPLSAERMTPSSRFAGSGRANPQGIAVLYCASDIKTALLEVRAPAGSACTVAHLSLIHI